MHVHLDRGVAASKLPLIGVVRATLVAFTVAVRTDMCPQLKS